MNRAFDALERWVRDGTPPPKAEPIAIAGKFPYLKTAVDSNGNAKGGVRSPYLEVPIATYYASREGRGLCTLFGYEVPFNSSLLKKLYPTHAEYVSKVNRSTDKLFKQGWLLKADAQQIKTDAAQAKIPQ